MVNMTEESRRIRDNNNNTFYALFVDDLKTYHRSEQRQQLTMTSTLKMYTDIGLEWEINKCAAIRMKRGKRPLAKPGSDRTGPDRTLVHALV